MPITYKTLLECFVLGQCAPSMLSYTLMTNPLPKLVTFDGDARSGKGTIVSLVKDYVRDELSLPVMLIDAGQVFRVLVVMMQEYGIDLDDPIAIDTFLADKHNEDACVRRVKFVYHLPRADRDTLLYTPKISANSVKIGARPRSQAFKDALLRKWLRDAREEGVEIVLLDGRALGEVGEELARAGLCEHVLDLFFVCDPVVSAQRTLGMMPRPYAELNADERARVDDQVAQITARNHADRTRLVQPVVPPAGALTYSVGELPTILPLRYPCPAAIIDRSIELPRETMALPVIRLVETYCQPSAS